MDAYILTTGTITVEYPCRHCGGTGHTEVREYCTRHSIPLLSSYPPEALEGDTLPCGCRWEDGTVRSEDYCPECEESGQFFQRVTLLALLAAFRQAESEAR